MTSKKAYADMTQEEREAESRKYIESQEPVVREEAEPLNPPNGNVPEPSATAARTERKDPAK